MWDDWKPYVSVAQRRAQTQRALERMTKKGRVFAPVQVEGRVIARTFWGKSWCDNLERYSDYDNRLPRGRTYVRSGCVLDLQIVPGKVAAMVSGSRLYEVRVTVKPVPAPRWTAIREDCAGGIDSLVELLQGRFSHAVMERICRPTTGLFPAPAEITFTCSCPDWADMCKHVAAVLYGIGARLDESPELLFQLRVVDHNELIAAAGTGLPISSKRPPAARLLPSDGLSDLFGLDIATAPPAPAAALVTGRPEAGPAGGSAAGPEAAPARRAARGPVRGAAAKTRAKNGLPRPRRAPLKKGSG